MRRKRNLAERAGMWSAGHRKQAIFGWLAFVIAAVVIGGAVGTDTLNQDETGSGESGRADKTERAAFPEKAGENVLVQARDGQRAGDPPFRAAVADVQRRLGSTEHVRRIQSPYAKGNEGQVSEDGRSALVKFDIPGDDEKSQDRVDGPLKAVAAAQREHAGLRIEQFGDASANKALSKQFEDDFQKAEVTSVPITLVILVVAFGALVAAGVPLLLALSAVAAAVGLIGPISQISPVEQSVTSVLLLIGLAVGVDYALFYLRREREERSRGLSEDAALRAAAATSGRAVLISGATVMLAMGGMYLAGSPVFTSFATGTILVVAIAMIGSVTVLPALLSKLGDRVNKGRIPFLKRPEQRTGESRAWNALLDRVLARPVISLVAAAGLLGVLAVPALSLKTQVAGIDTLPRSLSVMRTYDRIQEAFPGGPIPADVVIKADDVTSPEVEGAIADLRKRAAGSSQFKQPVTEDVSPDRTVAVVSIPTAGNGTDETSYRAVDRLRDEIVPATVGKLQGASVGVSGDAASSKDFNDTMSSHLPYVFAFVLGTAFLLLLVTFRSIVIPLKAILLNLLSVGAAYGVLVWIFQEGHLESLLGFTSTGAITSWLPLFLFVVLFGLSMDYHVFILSRVREAYDRGRSTADAVGDGVKTTAVAVTSAAVVMVAVFSIFATLSSVEFKQFGVGLALAILIDATIIRAVLLPAAMKLLGDWNWYLPKWLDWLPRVTHEPEVPREPRRTPDPEAEPARA